MNLLSNAMIVVKIAMVMVIGFVGAAPAAQLLPLVGGATYDQRQEGKVNVQIDVKDVQIVALVDSDMLEDYTNYDYAYDYADFTIKPKPTPPNKPTTASGSSTTPSITSSTEAEVWSTWPTTKSPTIVSNSTESFDNNSSSSSTTIPTDSSSTSLPIVTSSNSSTAAVASSIGNSTILVIPEVNVTSSQTTDKRDKLEVTTEIGITTTTIRSNSSSSSSDDTDGHHKRPHVPPAMAEPRKRCPMGFVLKSGRCFKRRLSLISPRFALMKLAPALLAKSAKAAVAATA